MGTPPMAWSPAAQKRAARTHKARHFFVVLRPLRHAWLDAALQQTLAQSSRPAPGGSAPVEPGGVALATRWQAYCHGSDQDAGERPVMAKRWQRVVDWLGAEPPPCRRGAGAVHAGGAGDHRPAWRAGSRARPGGGPGARRLTKHVAPDRRSSREDAQCQQKRRAKIKPKRGRASLRTRTAVEHALSPHVAPQGRRARSKGRRTQQGDGRRHAAVSTLQVAVRYEEERQRAS